jgi:hypothetical protein
MRRFLQHVLPKGLHKVRYFGLWHSSKRLTASKVRLLLHMERSSPLPLEPLPNTATPGPDDQNSATEPRICPRCGIGHLVCVGKLLPKQAQGP